MIRALDLSNILGTTSIIESICNWNAARYTQELNRALTVTLLEEEMDETVDAADTNDLVGICDGYADVFYVAIGGMWKHGLSPKAITQLLDAAGERKGILPMIYSSIEEYAENGHTNDLALVALKAVEGLENITKSSEAAFRIIRAVCDSNDSKEVKGTDSSVKANIAKGEGYISPTAAIKEVLNNLVEKPNE